jgi:hypothetical protein
MGEVERDSSRKVLGHARVFVLDAESTELLAFVTCS